MLFSLSICKLDLIKTQNIFPKLSFQKCVLDTVDNCNAWNKRNKQKELMS